MREYDHRTIEKKWQKKWQEEGLYRAIENPDKPKCYVLDMFPYPSGDGLHVGHPKGYIATDVYSRYKKMKGYNILHPMGWDAFGLPAEEYALKNKVNPRISTQKNVNRYKEQLEMLGFNYDWDREINTTDPEYYKWTQWIFLKLFEKGLAYESNEPINWCPSCKTGLANEDLEGNKCERCGTIVEQKPIRQWVLKIREYADRMLKDLDSLSEWPEHIKELQRNWIGRSEGAEFSFDLVGIEGQDDQKHKVKIFTTRPDTIFGATFMAVSPELAQSWIDVGWQPNDDIKKYIDKAIKDRAEQKFEDKEKTGVFSGIYAINPATNEKIPVWIANYVLSDIGTGAIMAVPAHDERDFEFANKYDLPIIKVLEGVDENKVYTGNGKLINSGNFNGVDNLEAKSKITKKFGGELVVRYRLKDWVFSRQRYWGEPIPLIHCEKCGVVPVPEKDLPVKLPEVENYEPTGTGESPLAAISDWVNTTCPKCGGPGKRETNTMPQWAGSCWYYLRYIDPINNEALVNEEKEKYWMPVDMYVGGAEHATRHLIYARFWHKFLYDIGVVSGTEPFKQLKSVGLILGEDGRKMSKRWGNVVNPDEIVDLYGADTLRVYEMFMGPFGAEIPWDTKNMIGSRRFIEKIWRLADKVKGDSELNPDLEILLNRTIKKVGEDIENFSFNTAISSLMILANKLEGEPSISTDVFSIILRLLAPFAPHMTEELWFEIAQKESIYNSLWPEFNQDKIESDQLKIVISINGKPRVTLQVQRGETEDNIKNMALNNDKIMKYTKNKIIIKEIFIPDKLLNFVVKDK